MTAPQTPLDPGDTPRDPGRPDPQPGHRPDPPDPALPPVLGARHRLREKLPELFLEAGSVVLAVLLALAVDEWRESRSRHALAARAQESIVRELRANKTEIDRIRESNERHVAEIDAQIKALEGTKPIRQLDVNMQLARLSSAAWQTAQSTDALQLLQFDWLVDAAGAYETQKLVSESQGSILSMIGDVGAAENQRDRLTRMRAVHSRLSILTMLSRQLGSVYDEVLKSVPPAP